MSGKCEPRPEVPRRRTYQFIRSTEEYTLSEYEHLFGNSLPHIVMVTQGGEAGDMMFTKGQILSIQAISRQERLVGKAVNRYKNELYGIPAGTMHTFCIVNKDGKATGKDMSPYEILRNHKLPARVQFRRGSVLTYGNKTISTNDVPQLDLSYSFDETHAMANFVVGNTIMEDIQYIPFHDSSLRVATVIGINGLAGKVFRSFKENTDKECLAYEYDLEYGKLDITVYESKGQTVTRCTKPLKYTSFGELFDRPYEEQEDTEADALYASPHAEEQSSLYEAPVNLSDGDGDDDDDGYEELTDIHRRQSMLPKAELQDDENVDTAVGSISTKADEKPDVHKVPPRPLPKPKPQKASETTEDTKLYTNDIPRGQVAPFIKSSETVEVTASVQPTNDSSEGKGKSELVKSLSASTKEVTQGFESESDPYKLTSVDIAAMSIEQVCDYLKRLRLEKYCDTFQQEMVDGEILQELNTAVLVDDFGFKKIEAIRLMKFVNTGHVPT